MKEAQVLRLERRPARAGSTSPGLAELLDPVALEARLQGGARPAIRGAGPARRRSRDDAGAGPRRPPRRGAAPPAPARLLVPGFIFAVGLAVGGAGRRAAGAARACAATRAAHRPRDRRGAARGRCHRPGLAGAAERPRPQAVASAAGRPPPASAAIAPDRPPLDAAPDAARGGRGRAAAGRRRHRRRRSPEPAAPAFPARRAAHCRARPLAALAAARRRRPPRRPMAAAADRRRRTCRPPPALPPRVIIHYPASAEAEAQAARDALLAAGAADVETGPGALRDRPQQRALLPRRRRDGAGRVAEAVAAKPRRPGRRRPATSPTSARRRCAGRVEIWLAGTPRRPARAARHRRHRRPRPRPSPAAAGRTGRRAAVADAADQAEAVARIIVERSLERLLRQTPGPGALTPGRLTRPRPRPIAWRHDRHGAHPQLLDRRPHRPRQVDARRPADAVDRHRRRPRHEGAAARTRWTSSASAASPSRPRPSASNTAPTTARPTSST